MQVTFRQVLTMLAVFDCVLITSITMAFSLPQISNYWAVREAMKKKSRRRETLNLSTCADNSIVSKN